MKHYFLDGRRIRDEESLYEEFARSVQAPNGYFGRRLSGFDDCLFGGYGLESPASLHWKHSEDSRRSLDANALVDAMRRQRFMYQDSEALRQAKAGELTLFNYVVDLITSVPERSPHQIDLHLELE